MRKLPRRFYDRDPIDVAQDILGKLLVHVCDGVERVGRIVEVEAYLGPHDLAAQSSKGLTPRTQVMSVPLKSCFEEAILSPMINTVVIPSP